MYCEYNYAGQEDRRYDTLQKNMRHFLERLADERASFNWGTSRVRPLPKCQGNGMYSADCPKCEYLSLLEGRDLVRNNNDKVVEKRQVDEDSEIDDVDVEEDFDPVINKGFCKSIFPHINMIVDFLVLKQRRKGRRHFPFT